MVSTAALMFRVDLNHDASIAQAKGDKMRIRLFITETEKCVESSFKVADYYRNGKPTNSGNVFSLESNTKASYN